MSPEAVARRLRLVGELWELSVKLMNSKPATSSENAEAVDQSDDGASQDQKRGDSESAKDE